VTRKPATYLIMRRDEDAAYEVGVALGYTDRQALDAHFGAWDPKVRMKHHAVRKAKPSYEMMHVLNLAREQGRNIHTVPLVDGKGSQSRTVGRMLTIEACQRRGWLDWAGNLTAAGRAAYTAEADRLESRT